MKEHQSEVNTGESTRPGNFGVSRILSRLTSAEQGGAAQAFASVLACNQFHLPPATNLERAALELRKPYAAPLCKVLFSVQNNFLERDCTSLLICIETPFLRACDLSCVPACTWNCIMTVNFVKSTDFGWGILGPIEIGLGGWIRGSIEMRFKTVTAWH